MIKKALLPALLSMLISPLFGIGATANSPSVLTSTSTGTMALSEATADYDLMVKVLEEAHPGLYRYTPQGEMDLLFAAQRATLRDRILKKEFEAVLAETLALIRCGHTSLNPDEEFETAAKNARTLPLRVKMEGTRLMVLFNDTPTEATIQPGMELLEINGRAVATIVARFSQVLSGDGDIETGKWHDLSGRFAKYYWWLMEQPDEFTVKARNAAGTTVVTRMPGVTEAERRSNHNPVNAAITAGIGKVTGWAREDLAVRFLKEPEVAEIRLRYFVGDNYPSWIEETFKMLRERGTRKLIIDLRGNGGGNDEYGAMLAAYLTDKRFRYFDHISVRTRAPSFTEYLNWPADSEGKLRDGTTVNPAGGYLATAKLNPCVVEQQPGKYPFRGQVFILIDGGTFSTAADFCAVARHLKLATFIGEETGGAHYGNNSGMMPTLTLPHSKIGIRLPLYAYWNAVAGDAGERRGTEPDFAAEMRVGDLLQGVEAPLELALKLATDSKQAR